jgi:hypothetical protein
VAHRILIVANQTLGSDALAATVRARVEAGATEMWIVAPATPPRDLAAAIGSIGSEVAVLDRSRAATAYELAEKRLEAARSRLSGLGVPVGGEVGDEDPLTAVGEVLAQREFDEVIVSTLPKAISHWLRTDLPSRIQRKHHLPVTTVTARAGHAS